MPIVTLLGDPLETPSRCWSVSGRLAVMSKRKFADSVCVFCRERPSSRLGEHAWPMWLLEMFAEHEGPYHSEINGKAVLKRDGHRRGYASIPTVQTPCCEPCNRELNRRFEQHPKPIIRKVIDTLGMVVLTPEEAGLFGLWWLKTMLLLSHEETVDSAVGVSPERWDLRQVPDDLYSWMVTGESPPGGLSVWFARRSDTAVPAISDPPVMFLPIVIADGRETRFMMKRACLKFCEVTLVYHPGWPIEHPLEATSETVRIWPTSEEGLDLSALRGTNPWPTMWVPGPKLRFADGAYRSASLPSPQNLLHGALVPGVVFSRGPGTDL
ncbi:hypothetical protein [Actinophytocola gossypii]|uniref:Uncharacterized protein n=1 Tax=Actinophytocola gossypii TaxID=2812003 RepID=A0ABT2JJI9_9PSEU|nr:hypothetical protein [Actinophytocola gossypii]MCT2587560.1 hypothetical protein [Actinophytocola gossypii]